MRQEAGNRKGGPGSGQEEDGEQKKFCKVKKQVFSFFISY